MELTNTRITYAHTWHFPSRGEHTNLPLKIGPQIKTCHFFLKSMKFKGLGPILAMVSIGNIPVHLKNGGP